MTRSVRDLPTTMRPPPGTCPHANPQAGFSCPLQGTIELYSQGAREAPKGLSNEAGTAQSITITVEAPMELQPALPGPSLPSLAPKGRSQPGLLPSPYEARRSCPRYKTDRFPNVKAQECLPFTPWQISPSSP